MRRSWTNLLVAGVVGSWLAAGAVSCTNPVRDAEIEALGDEDPNVPEGPDHRPGQPCVLCHNPLGPASGSPFAMGGTVYQTKTGLIGAPDVEVLFVAANNSAPTRVNEAGRPLGIFTTLSGNFFVRESEWEELAYPVKTGIYGPTGIRKTMQSHIGREPSCAKCHRDPDPAQPLSVLSAAGHIYLSSE